ncbi:peptide deformylase [Parapedobacter sp. 10938]|uniref:peptide deformylase n=1 Tax=Parapedobacter flavus TaxID=3110225 RepID=UPI002DBF894F|nr:peptide deformylase [Parapedobacter sp. 10938]MEC3880776.1 peptide deformylase [Parapedobacter sp. 10938]
MIHSLITKLALVAVMCSCVWQLAVGQYRIDSAQAVRQQKLERLAKDSSAVRAEDIQRPYSRTPPTPKALSATEREVILSGDTTLLMRVIQDTVAAEEAILRTQSEDIDPGEPLLPLLAKRMYLSVTDSLHPGVGIAAPQVGINRNLIWVQRFDKPGEPMELYLNPKITWRSKLLRKGLEGCLSIPDTMGQVLRNYTIRLTYQDSEGVQHEEMVEGFTAVIFQHETDHLYGILFSDRQAEQTQEAYHRINGETELYLKERLRRQ